MDNIKNIKSNRIREFKSGFKDGIPISMGYFAVSFTLGIVAKNAGLTVLQGFLGSLFINASAGEYAAFMLIASGGAYIEMIPITIIANARYFLMSCSISQKLSQKTPFYHRLIIGFDITDELFGIAIARKGYMDPFYYYGAVAIAMPGWATGTAAGIAAGNILSTDILSALSVALYGMFIAIIIPPAKKNKIIFFLVILSFITSFIFAKLPYLSSISSGTRTIILTVLISSIAAILFPIPKESENEE